MPSFPSRNETLVIAVRINGKEDAKSFYSYSNLLSVFIFFPNIFSAIFVKLGLDWASFRVFSYTFFVQRLVRHFLDNSLQ